MKGNPPMTAVVVGAGSKIGRVIILELARQGFKVGIVDYGEDDAKTTLEKVRRSGGTAELYSCDLSDLKQVRAMTEHFFAVWGEVGLLINNPGLDDCGRCVGDIPVEEWEEVIDTNLLGVIYACHTFIPRMIEKGGGHIANGTYGAGIISHADLAPYNIAKAGVISYTNKLRTELAPCDIGVTMLCSDMINHYFLARWLKRIGFDIRVKELIKG